jgi:hypothetical protein
MASFTVWNRRENLPGEFTDANLHSPQQARQLVCHLAADFYKPVRVLLYSGKQTISSAVPFAILACAPVFESE